MSNVQTLVMTSPGTTLSPGSYGSLSGSSPSSSSQPSPQSGVDSFSSPAAIAPPGTLTSSFQNASEPAPPSSRIPAADAARAPFVDLFMSYSLFHRCAPEGSRSRSPTTSVPLQGTARQAIE